ncbi:spore germination protein [Halalkalibacterium halodurans]|uniref:Stage V sporulation protein AF n=1 Tax=Halalkalibacterium halodurans TaxID=86665 RepID=A0A0M0KM48_ALKHA|nr:spore germination protein [Halalkalibacterium halodurans]MED3648515.1 spore germination protein [Halalkalibacterium halodurans]MED4173262.1 spore germination protein [Halalkalibacterium halodurans]TPE70475.1 spore germination protein [Halalkalibacterium halodurans]
MSESVKEREDIISPDIHVNEECLKERLGMDVSFDVGIRKLPVFDREIQLYYVNGLVDTQNIIELLKELMDLDARNRKITDVKKAVKNHLTHYQVEETDSMNEAVTQMLSGLIFILIDGETEAFVVDVRSYPTRGPEEPDTERVVRGSRDGYTENIIINTALTRRRIRDERLRHEILKVGVRSKTDICIAYIDGIVDPEMVKIVREELENIKIDGITMTDKIIEEYIVKQGMNPFPLVRYTERPDVAATHLLEGHLVIMVDTSPSVIIAPTTFFHHVQHAEEYRQSAAIGTFLRWVRFAGILFSLFILPFWLLLVMQPSLLPEGLQYVGPNETKEVPIFAQIIFAELGIELLRMAAIHTPSPLATALGLVAALLIGEIAIEVGLFSPEVILYVAIGAVGMFATPSYELSVALRVARLILVTIVALFKAPGFIIATTLFIFMLARIKTLNKPYLWPFLPFDPPAMWQIIIRSSVPTIRWRPSIVHPQDPIRQEES